MKNYLGTFEQYIPKRVSPEARVKRVIFCKNEDGKDWYEITQEQDKYDGKRSYLELNDSDIVTGASNDASMLFPSGSKVVYLNKATPDPEKLLGMRYSSGKLTGVDDGK